MTNKEYKKETRYFWLVKKGKFYYVCDLPELFYSEKIFDLYNNFDKYAKKYSIFIAGNSILFSLDRKRKQMCKYEVRHFRSEKNKNSSIREYSYPIYTKKYGFFDNWWNFNNGWELYKYFSGKYYYHVKTQLNNELNKLLVHDNIKDWKPLEEVFNAKTFNEWLEKQPIWLKWKNYENKNYKRCK